MQEMLVQSLGRKDPLEEEMATHSSILAWEIPQTEEPGGLQSCSRSRARLKQFSTQSCNLEIQVSHPSDESIPCKPCIGFIFIKGQIFRSVVRKLSSKANKNMRVFQTISSFFPLTVPCSFWDLSSLTRD